MLRYKEWSEKSDVWAFGVTMYECVTAGVAPYIGLTNEAVIWVSEPASAIASATASARALGAAVEHASSMPLPSLIANRFLDLVEHSTYQVPWRWRTRAHQISMHCAGCYVLIPGLATTGVLCKRRR